MEILRKKMLTTVFQPSLFLICWCTTTNNHQRVLQPLQLCFLFIITGIWIYGLQKASEFWLTDWEPFYFINTAWFNKQEIRKLILRNKPPENIFQPEDKHANQSEVILLVLLCTDARVLLYRNAAHCRVSPRREKVLEQHAGRQLNQKLTIRNKWLFKGSVIHAFTKGHLLGTNTSFILSAA